MQRRSGWSSEQSFAPVQQARVVVWVFLIEAFVMERSGAQCAPDLFEMFVIAVFTVMEAYRCGDDNVIFTHWCYRNACYCVTVPIVYYVGCCCTVSRSPSFGPIRSHAVVSGSLGETIASAAVIIGSMAVAIVRGQAGHA